MKIFTLNFLFFSFALFSCLNFFSFSHSDFFVNEKTNSQIHSNAFFSFSDSKNNLLDTCPITIIGIDTICEGDSTTLTASGGITYSWNTGATTDSIIVSPTATTNYSVFATTTCGTDTGAITITVNPLPHANFSGITSICSGNSSILSASGGTSYLWSTGETAVSILVSPTVTTNYILIAANTCGSDTDTIPMIVSTIPIAAISGDTSICLGKNSTLATSGGTIYLWSTGETTNSIIVSPTANSTYSVVVDNQCGSDTGNISVNVFPQSMASFSYQYDTCKASCIQFTDQSSNASFWLWKFDDGDSSAEKNPCHVFAPGQYDVVLITRNSFLMCPDMDTVQIKYYPADTSLSLVIPNVFTPNGDGRNDAFKISGLNRCSPFSLKIVDRWGGLMFETTEYGFAWDGRTPAGISAQEGIYYYFFSNNNSTKKGFVTLLK